MDPRIQKYLNPTVVVVADLDPFKNPGKSKVYYLRQSDSQTRVCTGIRDCFVSICVQINAANDHNKTKCIDILCLLSTFSISHARFEDLLT
jgi:hypothetical protein